MSARHGHRKQIEELARDAFKDHVLEEKAWDKEGAPYVWWCARPGSHFYSFLVMVGPGCIVQWGDVGGLVIAQGRGYGLSWLEDSIGSMSYVLEKSKAKRDEFVPELFQEYVREHKPGFQFQYDGSEPDLQHYWEETGDSEVGDCSRDYPSDALWAYWALHTFVRLRGGSDVQVVASGNGR